MHVIIQLLEIDGQADFRILCHCLQIQRLRILQTLLNAVQKSGEDDICRIEFLRQLRNLSRELLILMLQNIGVNLSAAAYFSQNFGKLSLV